MTYRLDVNGAVREIDVPRRTTLLEALRDDLDLTATRYGCGRGQCAATCSPTAAPPRRAR